MSIRGKSILLTAALAGMLLPAAAQDNTAATPAPEPTQNHQTEFRHRQVHQRRRIAQGVKSGELTKGEATTLANGSRDLTKEANQMREENGGALTRADKEKLNRQQNHLSRRVYRAKHNNTERK